MSNEKESDMAGAQNQQCTTKDITDSDRDNQQVLITNSNSTGKVESSQSDIKTTKSEISTHKIDPQKRGRSKSFSSHQGKTSYPKRSNVSKEFRELRRNNALIEKNLKIEGLPEQPKIRKRRLSTSSASGRPHDKKRRSPGPSRKDHLPNWEKVLGGDACDPLNLNGLVNTDEGRILNMSTPQSSPLPVPDFRKIIYVKVPPNIEDPLNLEGKHDQNVIDRMLDKKMKLRHRPKKKDKKLKKLVSETKVQLDVETIIPPSESKTILEDQSNPDEDMKKDVSDIESAHSAEATTPTKKGALIVRSTPTKAKIGQIVGNRLTPDKTIPTTDKRSTPTTLGLPIDKRTTPIKAGQTVDKTTTPTQIVSFSDRSSRSTSGSPERKLKRQFSSGKGKSIQKEPKFPAKPMFTHGNYSRYYGYRNKDHIPDPRLDHFDPIWFEGNDILDIGCNVGHITLALAEKFQPNKILGIDIDGKLIRAARQNIRHMLSMRRKDSSKFPSVFELTKGPLEAHPLMGGSDRFPNNVLFLQGNYVPASEEVLRLVKEEYDTILALSITKWIHLNSGDHGLKLFFGKIFRQLRPGGRLILEPQPWSTYRKRAKLTPDMFKTYESIKLKPEGFKHYLLSIGFVKCEVIAVPVTKAKGFRRPLIMFTKPDSKQSYSSARDPQEAKRSICTACGSNKPELCVHEFTGVRRGAYASYMYDHVNYPRMRTTDPDPTSEDHAGLRNFGGYSAVENTSNYGAFGPQDDGLWQRMPRSDSRGATSPTSQGHRSANSSMRSAPGSERSCSSYTSGSGSASTRSESSSRTASTLPSPLLHDGAGNGDIVGNGVGYNGISPDQAYQGGENGNEGFNMLHFDNLHPLEGVQNGGEQPLPNGLVNGVMGHDAVDVSLSPPVAGDQEDDIAQEVLWDDVALNVGPGIAAARAGQPDNLGILEVNNGVNEPLSNSYEENDQNDMAQQLVPLPVDENTSGSTEEASSSTDNNSQSNNTSGTSDSHETSGTNASR